MQLRRRVHPRGGYRETRKSSTQTWSTAVVSRAALVPEVLDSPFIFPGGRVIRSFDCLAGLADCLAELAGTRERSGFRVGIVFII